MRRTAAVTLVALFLAGLVAPASGEQELDAEQVQESWARRLAGRHYISTVQIYMPEVGERRMTMRWDDSQKRERLLLRIEWPDEIRGQSWLMLENSDRANEYYVYSTSRASLPVRRLRVLREGNPLAGTDPDYLGLGVARQGHRIAKSVTSTSVGDRKAFLLTEEAIGLPFDRREVWLDATTFVPLRAKFFVGDQIVLEAETEEIRVIQGVETPTRIRFAWPAPEGEPPRNLFWKVETVDYDRPILESTFSVPR